MDAINLFMIAGFLLAAYSIVANDAIQTLGTFLASNGHRPWWVLWIFTGTILAVTLIYGWVANGGDPSYGRLSKFPMPEGGITWHYVLPPLAILFLTRGGIPVSTTFLVLTVFTPGNLGSMLTKSLAGYGVAFLTAIIIVGLVSYGLERRFLKTKDQKPQAYWVVLQWCSTGYLWSVWLTHDLANIFAFLPREVGSTEISISLVLMLVLLGIIFYQKGGKIQKIVLSKTNTQDIRSATIIDFLLGCVLLVFKEWSNVPMSTTWVFLGLLAGREIAMSFKLSSKPANKALLNVGSDAMKAAAGLAVSVGLAYGIPMLKGKPKESEPIAEAAAEQTAMVVESKAPEAP